MGSEELLLAQLRQGTPAAYATLVERFEGPLYRFFYFDHRNHHVAQEQSAETFAQLVRSLPGMRGGHEQLRAFVFATARHVQLRRWRQRRRQAAPLSEAQEISDRRPSPDIVAAHREQLERVLHAIGRLEGPVRQVLLLRFVEGCAIEEIAQSLEMPEGTIKSHIHRGRMQLKEMLSEKECQP